MNVNQIINMIIRQITRRVISKGVDAGIGMASRKGQPVDEMSREERKRAQAGKETARKARRAAKMMRRMR